VHDSNPTDDGLYIRNRVVAKTVTPAGGSAVTLSTNSYDSAYLSTDAPLLTQHDVNMTTSFITRGNVAATTTTTGTTSSSYDIEGNAIRATDALGHVTNVTVDYYGNVPQTATPNGNGNLSTSFSFTSFLAPTSVSQPSNGTSATAAYDGYGRLRDSTSPDGAVTNYYYCPDACNPGVSLPATRNGQNYSKISVTNTRWSRDQYDGLGRVIRTDRGDTSGNVISNVDTDYDSCACSPTGKMVRTSQPYKPGDPIYWISYTYDGLGRTIQVTAADNASLQTTLIMGAPVWLPIRRGTGRL
jgi:YD repeat-containing protein